MKRGTLVFIELKGISIRMKQYLNNLTLAMESRIRAKAANTGAVRMRENNPKWCRVTVTVQKGSAAISKAKWMYWPPMRSSRESLSKGMWKGKLGLVQANQSRNLVFFLGFFVFFGAHDMIPRSVFF